MNLKTFSIIVSKIFFGGWIWVLVIAGLLKTGPTKLSLVILLPSFLALTGSISIAFRVLRAKGYISDWDVTKREERYVWFAIIVVVFLFSTIISYFFANFEFFVLNLCFLALAFSLLVLTFLYKISGHMITNVGSSFLLNYLFDWSLMWLFLIVPFVAFARIYLKKHTLAQVLAGGIVGLIEPYLVLKLLNII